MTLILINHKSRLSALPCESEGAGWTRAENKCLINPRRFSWDFGGVCGAGLEDGCALGEGTEGGEGKEGGDWLYRG